MMTPVYDVERYPQRPELPPERKSKSSLLPVVLVLVPLLLMIVGIVAFTGRAGLLMLAVVAAVPAFLMLHYVLWGYWLSKIIKANGEEDPEHEPKD
jgi:hypothetical protein